MDSNPPASSSLPRRACEHCWRHTDPGSISKGSCVETDRWPVVVLVSAGPTMEAQVQCRIRQLESIMAAGNPFALVIDATNAKGGDRGRTLTRWMEEKSELIHRYCHGVALVFQSTLVRFIVSSTLLLIRRPVPYKTFPHVEDAVKWARSQVRKIDSADDSQPGEKSD